MGLTWLNIIGRNPKTNEEGTIWNGVTEWPEVQIIVRPKWPEGEVTESE